MSESSPTTLASLLAEADLCVKCGLCLPHCPTYRQSRNEADGPRGRIALVQGLATGALAATPEVQAHLDGCLSCRACETVCPAKVRYGVVLDGGRTLLATPSRTRLARAFGWMLVPRVPRALLRLLLWALARLPLLRTRAAPRLLRGLPPSPRLRAPEVGSTGTVALFAGCMGDVLERQVLHDAATLLRATGLEVRLPAAQTCCGALHQHGGIPKQAGALAARNAAAFAGCETVLALTPGCGAALRDLLPTMKVVDLCAFLAERLAAHPLRFAESQQRIGVHVACTQANVLGASSAVASLLGHLPGATLLPLAAASGCCGAAGTHFISHPTEADALLAPKLDAAAQASVSVVVSANIGCSLHLAQGLRGRGIASPVVHPVSLLARAFRSPLPLAGEGYEPAPAKAGGGGSERSEPVLKLNPCRSIRCAHSPPP